jgi:ATP-dependent helicase/nuclease subunit A
MSSEPDLHLHGLNAQQRQAATAPSDYPVQVLAGAGTGKTELIARRFVHLLRQFRAQGIARPSERILVLTFTSDATISMRERINSSLLAYGEEALGPNVWIGNFHQVCLRLLRMNPLAVGLPPNFKIVGAVDQERLFTRLLTQVADGQMADLSALASRYGMPDEFPRQCLDLIHLERGPLDAIGSLLEPARVFALINRIKTAGLSPAQFWQEARIQSSRLTQFVATLPVPHDPALSKLENVIAKIQGWHQSLQGWAAPGWDPIAAAEEKATQAGKPATPSEYKKQVEGLGKLYLASKTFEPVAADPAWAAAMLGEESAAIDALAGLYLLYQDALLKAGSCDFDDLINVATRLLRETGLGPQVRAEFEAIIVDEFQDSNHSQLLLLEELCRPKASNLTVVGDAKQSIYAFRFAQPENLELIFRHQPPQPISLQTNYRSHPNILSAANHITTYLSDNPGSLLQTPDAEAPSTVEVDSRRVTMLSLDALLEPAEVDDASFTLMPKKKTKASVETVKPKAEPMDVQREREANFIAVEIVRLLEEEDYDFSQIAILVQSHGRAATLLSHLADFGIPAVRQKSQGFLGEPFCKDLLACLRLLRRLNDDTALLRLLQKKLSPRLLYQLRKMQKELKIPSLHSFCLLLADDTVTLSNCPQEICMALGDLARQLQKVRPLYKASDVPTALQHLVETLGLLNSSLPAWEQATQRLQLKTFEKLLWALAQTEGSQTRFESLMTTLEHYAANPTLDLPLTESAETLGNGEEAVKILTVHAAKGLEFPVVFAAYTASARAVSNQDTALIFDPQFGEKRGFGLILGKVQGRASVKTELYRKIWLEPRAVQERQRVFYVALTRAKERLYVIRGPQSFAWTQPENFPADVVEILSQTRDADYLAEYFQPDAKVIKDRLRVLQPALKAKRKEIS